MKVKIRRKDTEDRKRPGIDLHFPAQYGLVTAKPVLPDAITDHNNLSIGGVFLLCKDASSHGLGPQQRQQFTAHGLGVHFFRALAVAEDDMKFEKPSYRLKDRVLRLPVEIVARRNHVVVKVAMRVDFKQHRQL